MANEVQVDDLSGGQNFNSAAHLIEDNEARLIENAIWRNGKWEKREGYSEPYSATADGNAIIEITDWIANDGTTGLLACTLDRIYHLVSTTWTERRNLATTLATTEKVFFTEIFGKSFLSNGKDKVQVEPDPTNGTYADLTTSPRSITIAAVVLGFHSRLLFFNTTDGTDGAQPNRVQWSEVNDETDVQNGNWIPLDNSNAPIVSAAVFRSNAIVVYKTDSVWLLQDVGEPYYFQSRFGKEIGIIAPKARASMPSGDFFVSNQGFHLFVGNGVIDIDEGKYAYEYFRSRLNDAKKDNVYCWTDGKNKEIHIKFPTGAGDEPDEEIVFNYSVAPFKFCRFTGIGATGYCGFNQYRTVATPVTFYGSASGVTKLFSGSTGAGELDVATAISTAYQSKAFRQTPTRTTRGDDIDQDDYIQITQVNANISPTGASGATCKIGEADTGDETPDFSNDIEFADTDGRAPAAYPETDQSTGRFITIGFNDFDYLSSYDFEHEGAGVE